MDAGLKRILWWLVAGSRGGANRGRILLALRERPYNANQLADKLAMDYKTARHHLKVLQEHQVIMASGPDHYGAVYLLTSPMEQNWALFEEIWERLGKKESGAKREGGT